jgi:signal transduction histidine kinase/DNA-binding NarL/FixJ family response regulator
MMGGIIAAYWVGHSMSKPIKALAEDVRIIASGNLDQSIHSKTRDELGQLISDVEKMRLSIKDLTENLEAKVEERTKQLDQSNMELVQAFEHLNRLTEDLKTANEKAERERESAERANHSKSEFLAGMSHELRTPLNAILGYAQILKRDSRLTQQQREGISIIERSGNHLLELINDILDLAKIEAGKVELSENEVHLLFLLKEIGDMIRIRTSSKNLFFTLEIDPALPPIIRVDDRRLRQMLLNLLGNAVKFTEKGGIILRALSVSPFLPCEKDRTGIRFEVEDTGFGIAPEDIATIFDPFQQVGDSKYKSQGTGLGLSITRNLIRLMGGELQVSSTVGQGSIFGFHLTVPVVASESEFSPREKETRQIIGIEGIVIPKIVIADDKPENRTVLAELLAPLGFLIREAGNGREAWEVCRDFQPQVLITDLLMPEMDGITLIRHIRQNPEFKDMIVIATSASVYKEDEKKSFSAGSQVFLPKPIDMDMLLHHLQQLLKLTWCYQEGTENAVFKEHFEEEVLPPRKILETLYTYTELGDITELENHLKSLGQQDARFSSFVNRVMNLVTDYEVLKIQSILNDALSCSAPEAPGSDVRG